MDKYSVSLQAIERNFERLERSAERVSRAADNRSDSRSQASEDSQNALRNERIAAQDHLTAQASNPQKEVDLAAERVEQLNVWRSTEAQVKVLRTQDEMLGLIIDLKA